MTNQEFSDEFDVLYNNIMSNQAPGLDEYEKSVFLTKAQDELLKAYFNPLSNKTQEGFDGNQRRQIDFSMLTKVFDALSTVYEYSEDKSVKDGNGNPTYTRTESTATTVVVNAYIPALDSDGKEIVGHYIQVSSGATTGFSAGLFDTRSNTRSISLPPDALMLLNETATVTRGNTEVQLQGNPISYLEYSRLMSKPYKRPLKWQAWRIISNNGSNRADIVVGPNDTLSNYKIRYVKRPRAIILSNLDGVTIDNQQNAQTCELDPIMHHDILQRAVELAKAAYTGDLNSQIVMGQSSATEKGVVARQQ